MGGIELLSLEEKGSIVFDNRDEFIKTEGSVIREDNGGHVAIGDSMSHSVKIKKSDWTAIATLWNDHTLTTWEEEDGTTSEWYVYVEEQKIMKNFPECYQLKITLRKV